MTMKPPSGLAAESDPEHELRGLPDSEDPDDGEDLSDEVMVDASDDVTVEAAEEVTIEAVTRSQPPPEETPPPLSSLADSAIPGGTGTRPLPSFLGGFGPSLPLPGVTAAAPPRDHERSIDDDVTLLAHGLNEDVTRPALADDDEEETKVEPAETAIHAAATRDDVATALSEQASFERDKALRKSAPALFGSDARSPRSGGDDSLEFADPEDENDDDDAVISADPVVDDDDDGIEVGGSSRAAHPANDDDADDDSTAMFAKAPDSSPMVAALTARRPGSPPTGSPFGRDTFGSARLPSPTPGFAGLSLSSPAPAPAPASSPFARLAPAPAGSPYGARVTASALPALQIPAPSGAAAAPSGVSGLSRRVEVPVWVLWALFLAFPVALVLGWSLHTPPPAPPVVAARPPLPPVTAPVVQPVPPPPATSPTPIPAASAGSTPPATVTKTAGTAPSPGDAPGSEAGGTEGLGEPLPPPQHPVKRIIKPRKPIVPATDDLPAAKPAATAKPPVAKPAKPAKPASKPSKAWVDPFAQ